MAIFKVTPANTDGSSNDQARMVDAPSSKAAIAFVANDEYTAEKLSTKDALALASDGVKLEDVKAKDAPKPKADAELPEPTPSPVTVAAESAAQKTKG